MNNLKIQEKWEVCIFNLKIKLLSFLKGMGDIDPNLLRSASG